MGSPVSLTSFTDFVSKTGITQVTAARKIKRELDGNYEFFEDYWLLLRRRATTMHAKGESKTVLSDVLSGLNAKKVENYKRAISGYQKFLGKRPTKGAKPKPSVWSGGGIEINVNPEVHLQYDGSPALLKLYFKGPQISKLQVEVILHLLKHHHPTGKKCKVGVVDVQRGKVIFETQEKPDADLMLLANATSLGVLLKNLGE